ncbi:hypothetical protein AURDEDRAFT_128157 [Auricularia subglabra TFB-10046 SS5]|uniref:HAT C-terminal dimerisation domain-containing protein n=1 Tax=Auricularia subglabra (strain TFB-10046 / SS5) TaxID=717982 RepID=J0WVS3_AURST|nr:hypothetical protein AURDEDRAFT_128157 [Auricularia subglabra TFB-10046 SS5]
MRLLQLLSPWLLADTPPAALPAVLPVVPGVAQGASLQVLLQPLMVAGLPRLARAHRGPRRLSIARLVTAEESGSSGNEEEEAPPQAADLAVLQHDLDTKARRWHSPAYGFFGPPKMVYHNKRIAQEFLCLKCGRTVHRYQDTQDRNSTANLRGHVTTCASEQELAAAAAAVNDQEKYSKYAFTETEMRIAAVRWIAQDLRPVSIIRDRDFLRIVRAVHIQGIFAFMAITLDNASNNTAMVRSLQHTLPDFEGEDAHGNCIAHILNLIAKAITAPFGRRFPKSSAEAEGNAQDAEGRDVEGGNTEDVAEAEELDEELDEEVEQDEEFELPDYANNDGTHYEDEEDDFDAEEDFSDLLYAADDEPGAEDETMEAAQLARAAAVVGRVLSKIRKLSIKVLHSSTSLRPIWFAVLKELHLPPRSLPRDVDNRWNSTFLLVQFVLQYKLAVDTFTKSKVALKPFTLGKPDWTLLDQLSTLLKPLFIYTEFFSRSDFAGVCYAIRVLHHIDRALAAFISGQYSPALIAAARLGRLKLQKYKAILQHKKLYLFAAAWFRHSDRQGKFSAAWINELVQQISEEFKEKYLPLDTQNVSEAEEPPMSVEAMLFGPSPVKSTSRHTVGPPSELERYLSQPIETTNDIIKWWWDCRDLYPHLHQMATDYCSVPGMCSSF